ncbi:dnaJ homolog subfamily C member 12 [Esox lucius]|uniref:DnaJ homolog subfamily C member 12 n=1 Tax=Esox lucius TaxID=8010 RepID=C1BXK7_ESOLU|nr:dnaJ homolog subfamily C member 12 [Esox lucius]ACO13760.1 DnaJ homolog subfamily C member 12 [Esox lucius]
MDCILNCKPENLEDYYGLLGCDESSSSEQIANEYRVKALACHPDKHPDNPRAVEEFQKLQEAKDVLCNENSRRNYDVWRRSGITLPFHAWLALGDSVKTSMHWAVKTKKEPMLECSKATFPDQCQDRDFKSPELPSPDTVLSSSDYCHRHFRWASDSPSSLLQKFRNYQI